jgi:hypothetical protein
MARKSNPENVRPAGTNSGVTRRRQPARNAVRSKHTAVPAETVTETAETSVAPTHEDIALLAYTYWQERGCVDGCSEEDWARAERELRSRADAATA